MRPLTHTSRPSVLALMLQVILSLLLSSSMAGVKFTSVTALIRLNSRIEEIGFILQKLQLASSLVVGQRIAHPKHGSGVVVAVNFSGPRLKPFFVRFDNGDSHRYSMTSAAKLTIASQENSSSPQQSVSPHLTIAEPVHSRPHSRPRISSLAEGALQALGVVQYASEGSVVMIGDAVFDTSDNVLTSPSQFESCSARIVTESNAAEPVTRPSTSESRKQGLRPYASASFSTAPRAVARSEWPHACACAHVPRRKWHRPHVCSQDARTS